MKRARKSLKKNVTIAGKRDTRKATAFTGIKVKEFDATCADTERNNEFELMLVAFNKEKVHGK